MMKGEEFVIEFYANTQVLKFEWKEKLFGNDRFKEIISQLAKQVKESGARMILVDARSSKFTLSKEVQQWHDEVIVPQYLESGVHHLAFLTPKSIFAELTHKKTFEQGAVAKTALSTKFFQEEAEAYEWLLQENRMAV